MNLHTTFDKNAKRYDRWWRLWSYTKEGIINWIEIYKGRTHLSFNVTTYGYDDAYGFISFSLIYFSIYLKFPFWKSKTHKYGELELPRYGFSFCDCDSFHFLPDSIHIHLGKKTKIYDMPWLHESMATIYTMKYPDEGYYSMIDIRCKDYKKYFFYLDDIKPVPEFEEDGKTRYCIYNHRDEMYSESFDFTYNPPYEDDPVQKRLATAYEKIVITRPKGFKFSPFLERRHKRATIVFSEPVGDLESWKGGTYEMSTPFKDDEETLEDVVKRVEREHDGKEF